MITISLERAKGIAHHIRREMRAKEFEPLDEAIAKQIPGQDPASIEAQRQGVRDKYSAMQEQIDAAGNVDAVKAALAP